MKAKHTPGPWYYYSFKGQLEVGTSGPVNHKICEGITGQGSSFEERKANACLISAAPDLLEAIKSFRDACTEYYRVHGKSLPGEFHQAVSNCSKAIAKAEGEE